MVFSIITIFPKIFDSYFKESLLGKAIKKNIISVNCIDLRKYANNKNNRVDDRPFGGGPGMVLKIGPIYRAIKKIKNNPKIVLLSPRGKKFNSAKAYKYSKLQHLVLICGRYEGVDARIKHYIDEEISIGDYILSGGEVAAMVVVESVARFIPGVLGNKQSINDNGYPVYTHPREFRKKKVPQVLLSGDHAKIAEWRKSAQD